MDSLWKIMTILAGTRTRQFGKKIDARGQLPDGTQFEGSQDLKNIIVSNRMPNLTRQLTEKLLTYALGRQLEYYDEATIRSIVNSTTKNEYRFQTLIESVIYSQPFLKPTVTGRFIR